MSHFWAAMLRRQGVDVQRASAIIGRPRVFMAPGSRITLGDQVSMIGKSSANTLDARGPCVLRTVTPEAVIEIGDLVGMSAATISASRSVTIGDRTMLGAGAVITDSDHHVVDAHPVSLRRTAKPIPQPGDEVVIGSDVFVGARVIILKGVTIGNGSVIAAGSIVASSVPPAVVAGGNPARVVRALEAP